MTLVVPVFGGGHPGHIKHSSRVAISMVITDAAARREAAAIQSANISDVFHYPAVLGQEITGNTLSKSSQALEVSDTVRINVAHGISVGSRTVSPVNGSIDVNGGESFLIIADIVKAVLGEGNEAQNNIQVIDLDDATGGTWLIWLNYGGYVLDTETLPFDASALEVYDALVALPTVPNPESIIVNGVNGGPYTVEFTDEMGNRFISPLVIETIDLEGQDSAGVDVSQTGRPVGSFASYEVGAQLKVNNVVVPIKEFEYQEPKDKLGALLNIRLARPDVSQVPYGASIEFALTVKDRDGNTTTRKYIENGKISGRDYKMAYRPGANGGPIDEVSFGSIDVMADRFTLSPRRPVVMFDPNRVSFSDVQLKPRDAVVDIHGNPILPVYEHIAGLSMRKVLQRAYTNIGGHAMTTWLSPGLLASLSAMLAYLSNAANDQRGLAFSSVFTNIPDYKMKRADFGIEDGWHSGAQPSVGMYNPLYLPFGNVLYIVNVEFPLPFGALPRVVSMSQPQSLTQTIAFKSDANAVLLTYQVSAAQDAIDNTYLVVEFEEATDKSEGVRTRTRTRWLRKRDIVTSELVGEVQEEVMVETRTDFGSGTYVLNHRETTQNFYDDDLKIGHSKVVEGLVLVGADKSAQLLTLLTETCHIEWKEDPFTPGQKIQARNSTRVTGLIYYQTETFVRIDPETGDEETVPYAYPIILAQQSGIIAADEFNDTPGAFGNGLIETTEETLRHVGGNQFDVAVVTTDHITKTVKRSVTSPRVGDTASNPFATRAKTMLRRDLVSEADIGPRIPLSINTGELPRNRAIALADTTLYRAKNPLQTFAMPLTDVDFGIAKGTIVIGQTRYGYTNRHIIVGLSITGRGLEGTSGPRITMNLDGMELPNIVSG